MAIDQNSSTSPAESSVIPAIDNEFPTYRAISSTAVLSLVFGLAAVFCFASLWFLVLSAASVLLGLHSLRKIRQLPDVLTGAGLARVGIGVGVLFALTSVTRVVTEHVTITIDASQFAKRYIGVIKDQPISVALWYQQPLAYRDQKSPDELVDELKKSRSPANGNAFDSAVKPIQEIKDRIDGGKGGEIVYDQIESKAIEGLTVYANALIKLDLKGSKEHPEKEQYALFRLFKDKDDWLVREVLFPYTPKSAIATVEKKHDDDGHGH